MFENYVGFSHHLNCNMIFFQRQTPFLQNSSIQLKYLLESLKLHFLEKQLRKKTDKRPNSPRNLIGLCTLRARTWHPRASIPKISHASAESKTDAFQRHSHADYQVYIASGISPTPSPSTSLFSIFSLQRKRISWQSRDFYTAERAP